MRAELQSLACVRQQAGLGAQTLCLRSYQQGLEAAQLKLRAPVHGAETLLLQNGLYSRSQVTG